MVSVASLMARWQGPRNQLRRHERLLVGGQLVGRRGGSCWGRRSRACCRLCRSIVGLLLRLLLRRVDRAADGEGRAAEAAENGPKAAFRRLPPLLRLLVPLVDQPACAGEDDHGDERAGGTAPDRKADVIVGVWDVDAGLLPERLPRCWHL